MAEPYVARNPGDLIAAGDWNQMQVLVREDIDRVTKKAISEIQKVPRAGDADKLEGSSKSELIDQIVARAVAEIRAKSGYLQIFKVLPVGKEKFIKHDLHLFPLVDVYQLDYFPVVCSEDGKTSGAWTTFYLHHSSEKKLRAPDKQKWIEIQPTEEPVFKLSFPDLLDRYEVKYTDDTSLSEVETDFWEAFFAFLKHPKDEEFDDNQYCHSPWFDRCCREEKTVRDVKSSGAWENSLWVQFRARKTVNYPAGTAVAAPPLPLPAPTQIQVTQYDQDTLGLLLLADPVLDTAKLKAAEPVGSIADTIPDFATELKVMVLLKV